MSALPSGFGYSSCDGPSPGQYVKNQSAFYLHDGFTLDDLKAALSEAKANDCGTVYIKNPGKQSGHTGVCTWYVEALIPRLENLAT